MTALNFRGTSQEEYGVATIPVSAFYKNKEEHKVLRFCFAKNESTLAEAAMRLSK